MNNENTKTSSKGRFAWVIGLLEVIIVIAYFAIGFGGIFNAVQNTDFEGIFRSVETAIWFLVIATVVVTILCFLPPFKSKWNMYIAVWNIIWLGFSFYTLLG